MINKIYIIPDFSDVKYGNIDNELEWELSREEYKIIMQAKKNIELIYQSLGSGEAPDVSLINKIVRERKIKGEEIDGDILYEYSHIPQFLLEKIKELDDSKKFWMYMFEKSDVVKSQIKKVDPQKVVLSDYLSFIYDAIDFGVNPRVVPKLMKKAEYLFLPKFERVYNGRKRSPFKLIDDSKENMARSLCVYARLEEKYPDLDEDKLVDLSVKYDLNNLPSEEEIRRLYAPKPDIVGKNVPVPVEGHSSDENWQDVIKELKDKLRFYLAD